MNRDILQGDVLDKLKEIPDESIDCIITSPPYWNLRDYGVEGQMGLEPDFRDYLKKLRAIMDECKRVLKDTGTAWINLGDTYSQSGKGAGGLESKESFTFDKKPKEIKQFEAKTKYGIPERFYIQCIDDGWLARNFIPWVKGNAMPDPVKDRFTNRWEPVFFFAKKGKYYFNLDNVRIETITPPAPKKKKVIGTQSKLDGDTSEIKKYNKQDNTLGADGKPKANYTGFSDRYIKAQQDRKYADSNETLKKDHSGCYDSKGNCLNNPKGKNPGDVFFINTQPYPGSHFATFPPKLPDTILRCACPDQVCNECGVPRFPISKPTEAYQKILDEQLWKKDKDYDSMKTGNGLDNGAGNPRVESEYVTTGYTKCDCNKGFSPGIVLDPFLGAGTVGLSAEKLGLQWMGIELNKEYVTNIRKRLDAYKNNRMGDY